MIDILRNAYRPKYGGTGTQIYQGPFDLTKPIASSVYDATTGAWTGNQQAYQGAFDLNKPLASFGSNPTPPSATSPPMIQPPGTPQGIPVPNLMTSGAVNQTGPATPQTPMPGNLGQMAQQSILAQGGTFGDNWSSMF